MTVTDAQAAQAVLARFTTLWVDDEAAALTPIVLENETYNATAPAWVLLTIVETGSQQRTIGAPGGKKYARMCAAIVEIRTPTGTGPKATAALASVAREIYEGVTMAGPIWFGEVEKRSLPPEGQWQRLAVIAPFTYHQTR